MAFTPLDIRQSETRILQDQLNINTVVAMDSTLASINNELTPPGRLIAQATPSLAVTVGNGTIVNANTGKHRTLPSINGGYASTFTGGTITFPSTSGTITVSPGTNASITIGASQFVAVLVQVSSAGQISVHPTAAASSTAAAIALLNVGDTTALSLGYVVVNSNGSSVIQNIIDADLYQFVEGAAAATPSFAPQAAGTFLAGPTSGPNATPSFRAMVATDVVLGTAYLREEEPSGTNAGTFTSGSWVTRVLNTITDISGIVTSLSSNQFVLPPGSYSIYASAPAFVTNNHQTRLQNITDSVTVFYGSSAIAGPSSGTTTASTVIGTFTIVASKTFEIQHQCMTTVSGVGLGGASVFSGNTEVYTQVMITKIG